jgi:hypothetical protein
MAGGVQVRTRMCLFDAKVVIYSERMKLFARKLLQNIIFGQISVRIPVHGHAMTDAWSCGDRCLVKR